MLQSIKGPGPSLSPSLTSHRNPLLEADIMHLNPTERRLAELLEQAYRDHKTIDLLPPDLVPIDEASAYRVASDVIQRLKWDIGGWKIGATAVDNLHELGAARPIIGQIARESIVESPHRFVFDSLMTPVCECEFAFELEGDLEERDEPWTAADVAARIVNLYPAIEIGERRLTRGQVVPILALIADNSAAGKLVLGEPIPDWRKLDLAAMPVRLSIDSGHYAAGHGRDVLGNPLNALAWLADQSALLGRPLQAGEIVSTGSCTGMKPLKRGARLLAEFGDGITVEAAFD